MSPLFFKLMKKIVRRLDPKFEKYRPEKEAYRPKSKEELIEVLARSSKQVLSTEERMIITSAITIKQRKISSIMLEKSKMTFVHENDFLGPLMLDKLYKSGFEHFPVLGAVGRITGLIHTKELNSLKNIDGSDRALKYLDENVYYLRDDYSIETALAAFMRSHCYFFIVTNKDEKVVGLLTYEMLIESLLGRKVTDDFSDDLKISAVARRN